jgi:mRNA interferase HigB
MSKTDFESFGELEPTFNAVDRVGRFTVFDIGGNKYRLIAAIHYNRGKVYIRHIMTHRENSKSEWSE